MHSRMYAHRTPPGSAGQVVRRTVLKFPGFTGHTLEPQFWRSSDVHVQASDHGPPPCGLRIHQGASKAIQRANDVSSPRGRTEWLLCMASAAALEPRRTGCSAASPHSRVVHDQSRHLRCASCFLDLREAGETCSKHRVARLMREANLRALHGYRMRRWSVGKPSVLVPNLLQRQFTVSSPNRAWVTDITYIRTWQGWLDLAVVMDLFSCKFVGWSAGPSIQRELVLDAVLMAVRRRRARQTVIHSDRGTQYGSDAWRRFSRTNRLEPRMSRKGTAGTMPSPSPSSVA
jgi:hypothetical protein